MRSFLVCLFGCLFFLSAVIKGRLAPAHAHWGLLRQTRRERREWEERGEERGGRRGGREEERRRGGGRTTKSCGCLSRPWLHTADTGAHKPAAPPLYSRIYPFNHKKENQYNLFSTRWQTDRRDFSLFVFVLFLVFFFFGAHLGATSQTRWRTRPCLSAPRSAQTRPLTANSSPTAPPPSR